MSGLAVQHTLNDSVTVLDGDIPLFRYVYVPDSVPLESPKPYLHPLRTRAGHEISLFRPHDHVWHKGIAWSLPHVGDQNFWGGPTYVHGQFYVQLDNNGVQQHRATVEVSAHGDAAAFIHELDWITQSGAKLFTERRSITAQLLSSDSWMLQFTTAMTNVSDASISIGSPTTKGRENAGYSGLFWRGPRSFTGGSIVSESGIGGDELRGSRQGWLGFSGRNDESGAHSTLVIVDHHDNPHHPPQWFARSEEFACLNPAPFFSEELEVRPGETIAFSYGIGIADHDHEHATELAQRVRERISR